MDNTHIFSPQQPPPPPQKEGSSIASKILIGLVVVLFFVGIGSGSYYIGKQKKEAAQSESLSQTLTIPTQNLSPTTSPTPVSTVSADLSPTNNLTKTPSPSPTPPPKTITAQAEKLLDGFRSSNDGGNSTVDIRAGRNINLVTRGFASFDISEVPNGAKISQATLRLYQAETTGSPYTVGGTLQIDHLNFGDSLDNTDYAMAALTTAFDTISTNGNTGWKEVDVTVQVKDDMANSRSRSQFRIHFETEVKGGDAIGDFIHIESANNSEKTGNIPQLIIKYH